ncbi:hypothetical protein AAG906_017350 [Vitis piasezkii]
MTTIASNKFKDEKEPCPTPYLSLVLSLSHNFLHRKGHGTEHNNPIASPWPSQTSMPLMATTKPGWLQISEIPKEMLLVQLHVKLISLNNFRSQDIWVSRKFAGLISLRTNKLNWEQFN